MKNTVLFLFSILLINIACKSKGSPPQGDPGGNSVLSMKINGVEWKATEKITGSLGVLQDKQFVLGGVATPGNKQQNMNILLENVSGPGTYTTSASAEYDIVQYLETDSNGEIAMYQSQKDGLFTINITRCNGLVTEGTFSGSLSGNPAAIIITDGKFKTQ